MLFRKWHFVLNNRKKIVIAITNDFQTNVLSFLIDDHFTAITQYDTEQAVYNTICICLEQDNVVSNCTCQYQKYIAYLQSQRQASQR